MEHGCIQAKFRFSVDGVLHYGRASLTYGKPYQIVLSAHDGYQAVVYMDDFTRDIRHRCLADGRTATRERTRAEAWLASDTSKRKFPLWTSFLAIAYTD